MNRTPLKIYSPTVGVIQHIGDYIKTKNEQKRQSGEGGYYNQRHLTMISFLIKDWRDCDSQFGYLESLLKTINDSTLYNYDRFMLLDKIVDKINYGIKPTITIKCGADGCKKEVEAFVRFRSFKSLFDFSNISDELLSDTE